MPRVLWKGAISFGLVNIPVGLYPAEKKKELSFSMLDKRDLAPVGYKRVNKESGKEVPWEQVVKGYEYGKDRYVVLSDEDFRRANVEATQTVDIVSFVEAAQIEPVYFETPYYLAADKRGEKVYTLLREALVKSNTIAIGLIVIRTKQYLCALMPVGKTLLLNTLRYADEVLDPAEHSPALKTLEDARVSQREFGMALKLVEDMRQKWQPDEYRDTYREDLLNRIEEKVQAGQTKTLTPAAAKASEQRTAEVVDLTELLRRSLEKRGGKSPAGGAVRRAAPARSANAASDAAPAPSRARKSAASGGTTRRRRSA